MENLSVYLCIRLTQTTKESLDKAAKKLRRHPSELARMAIEDLLTNEGFPTYKEEVEEGGS